MRAADNNRARAAFAKTQGSLKPSDMMDVCIHEEHTLKAYQNRCTAAEEVAFKFIAGKEAAVADNLDLEERRFRFEARRLAVETYIKVHVERSSGARLLVASYFRLIFTLSVATLAAIVTLGSAWARFGAPGRSAFGDPATLVLSMAAIVALICSAMLAANGLRRAAGWSLRAVRDPLPNSGTAIEQALSRDDASESEIFERILVSMDEIARSSEIDDPGFMPPLLAYLAAVVCAIAAVILTPG